MRGGDVLKKNAIVVRGKADSFLMARVVVAGQPARYQLCPPEKMPMQRICQPELTDGGITQESAWGKMIEYRVNLQMQIVNCSDE